MMNSTKPSLIPNLDKSVAQAAVTVSVALSMVVWLQASAEQRPVR
jgi:hypothetical protein